MPRPSAVAITGLGVLWILTATAPRLEADGLGPDVFVGYSFARVDDVDRHGAALATSFHVVGPLSGFVDASGHFGHDAGLDRNDLTLMAGPGVRFGLGRSVLFVRGLAGLLRDSSTVSVLDVSISESGSRFAVLAGGGVDVALAWRWAVRLQGDYLWQDAKDATTKSGFRLAAGAVYRFGVRP